MTEDTISAVATAPGEGGIGIIRISGSDAKAIAAQIFRPHSGNKFRCGKVFPKVAFGRFRKSGRRRFRSAFCSRFKA